jgi:hypothetical protein
LARTPARHDIHDWDIIAADFRNISEVFYLLSPLIFRVLASVATKDDSVPHEIVVDAVRAVVAVEFAEALVPPSLQNLLHQSVNVHRIIRSSLYLHSPT